MHSIRVKITAVTIAAVLTSILALGGIGILTIGLESDRSSVEKMKLISENMQRKLDGYLDSIKQSVDMAINIACDSLNELPIEYLGNSGTAEKVAQLDAAMAQHCVEVERAFHSIANGANGVVTYYYCIDTGYGSNEHGFFYSKMGNDAFVKQPALISSDLDPKDTAHTTWYYSPLRAGRAVWVGPYKAHYLGEVWTISYVAPIYYQGFLVGVLGMDILFETMISQISSLQVYDTGFAFLMNRDGDVIYHPDMRELGDAIELDESLGNTLLKRRSTGDALVRYERDGESWQMAFSTLNDDNKVAVTAPVSEITISQRQLTLIILLVAVVILAVFTFVTLLLMNALTQPLLRLAAASELLMAGEYDVEVEYHGKDEVGVLTRAFEQMRDHLKMYINDLNSRANTDAMTGVRNKGAFTASLARLNDAIRFNDHVHLPQFSIIIFDCNNLKQINDVHGHEYGDIYLKTACRLIELVFANSLIFRIGGDEFAVILQSVDYQNRETLMNAFDKMAEDHNAMVDLPWEKISISRGLADYDPNVDQNVDSVLHRADALMYEFKRKYKQSLVK